MNGRSVMTLLAAACVACESAPSVAPGQQAEQFVAALNAGSVDRMMAASRSPFGLRDQAWETAPDGEGFVLGKSDDRTCADDPCRRRLFADLVKRVKIEGGKAERRLAPGDSSLADFLKGTPAQWREGVEWFLFLRGSGDVEHVALVGVDSRRRKIAALYVN
jgi:hypothetical protein